MVTKKKIPTVKKEEIKPQPIKKPVINFEEIRIVTDVKYDLNWISIRRKIQLFNIFKNTTDENDILYETKFNLFWKKFPKPYRLVIENYWLQYCYEWNKLFNKEVLENGE
jgi:hypothetical protein